LRRKNKLVIWPAYFEAGNSWREGRRVPKALALRGVNTDEIFRAATDMDLNPELRTDAAYPRQPRERTGFILVDKGGRKMDLVRALAKRIQGNRIQK
jgi:signal recognition particle subunit SRP19